MNFNQFLKGEIFQDFKLKVLEFYGNECDQCGNKHDLRVYFKKMVSPEKAHQSDAIVLCCKHGNAFLKERRKHKPKPHWVNKQDTENVSNRYVRSLFRKEGLPNPSKDLISVKKVHIKVQRAIKQL